MKRTLLRALLEGFGWEVGKQAAKEAVTDFREEVERHVDQVADDIDTAKRARAEAKAKARADAERAKREAREKREIEDDLAALKKRIERD